MFRPLSFRSCLKLLNPSLSHLHHHCPVTAVTRRLSACPALRSFSSALALSHSDSNGIDPIVSQSNSRKHAYLVACRALPRISTEITPVADLVSGSYALVDNTEFVPGLALAGNQSLLLAPRKFGKSVLCKIVKLYHELDVNQAQQVFKRTKLGAFIEANKSAHKQRKVIFLSLDVLTLTGDTAEAVEQAMHQSINDSIMAEAWRHGVHDKLIVEPTASQFTLSSLIYLLNVPEFGGPPAVIIDEYDTPIMGDFLDEHTFTLHDVRIRVLASIFAVLKNGVGSTVHSELVTGECHTMWRSLYRAASNLMLLSYEPSECRPQLGYTWKQIEHTFKGHIDAYCTAYLTDKETLKKELTSMYNGYTFNASDAFPLFNPWSILKFFCSGELEPHWASLRTLGYSAFITTFSSRVIDSLLGMTETPSIQKTDLSTRLSDLRHFNDKEQLAFLVHTGNLTLSRTQPELTEDNFGLSRQSLELQVPNSEVRANLMPKLLQTMYGRSVTDALTRRNAELIGAGTLEGLRQVLCAIAKHWTLDTKLSSRSDELEEQISQGVAHIFVFLGTTFKLQLPFVGKVLSKACNDSMKRQDLAYTIGRTTHLIEFVCSDADSAEAVDTSVEKKETEVMAHVLSVKQMRPRTKVVAYVAIFDRQASLLRLTCAGEFAETAKN